MVCRLYMQRHNFHPSAFIYRKWVIFLSFSLYFRKGHRQPIITLTQPLFFLHAAPFLMYLTYPVPTHLSTYSVSWVFFPTLFCPSLASGEWLHNRIRSSESSCYSRLVRGGEFLSSDTKKIFSLDFLYQWTGILIICVNSSQLYTLTQQFIYYAIFPISCISDAPMYLPWWFILF